MKVIRTVILSDKEEKFKPYTINISFKVLIEKPFNNLDIKELTKRNQLPILIHDEIIDQINQQIK